jgi:hypothetical protein
MDRVEIVELYVYMTKRENLDHSYMRKFCPRRFSNFIFTPSIGSFGGLITMVNGNLFNELISQSHFQITVEFTCLLSGMVWYLYNICGPGHNKFREEFFCWINDIDTSVTQYWMFMGDSNLTQDQKTETRME